jgi:hypothetical protein
MQLGLGHMRIIVPEEFAVQAWPVSDKASGNQQHHAD